MSLMEMLIQDFGYWLVLAGTMIEGETALILGTLAAYGGYLELPWVIAAAFTGGLTGDLIYFYLGRRHGKAILARHPRWERRAARLHRLVHRYHVPAILANRFMYGVRSVGLIVIGLSAVPYHRFVILSALGVALWATVVGTATYLLGAALGPTLETIKQLEMQVFAGLAIVLAGGWLVRSLFRQRLA
jgi:membrane protein DedA with SNARE-associated domain